MFDIGKQWFNKEKSWVVYLPVTFLFSLKISWKQNMMA